jgi:hypothetical protein
MYAFKHVSSQPINQHGVFYARSLSLSLSLSRARASALCALRCIKHAAITQKRSRRPRITLYSSFNQQYTVHNQQACVASESVGNAAAANALMKPQRCSPPKSTLRQSISIRQLNKSITCLWGMWGRMFSEHLFFCSGSACAAWCVAVFASRVESVWSSEFVCLLFVCLFREDLHAGVAALGS